MHIAIVFSVRPSVTTLWEYFSNGTDDRSGWHAIRLRRLHKNYKELLREYFRIIMLFFSWRIHSKVFYDWSHCTLIHFSSIMKCPSIILTPYSSRNIFPRHPFYRIYRSQMILFSRLLWHAGKTVGLFFPQPTGGKYFRKRGFATLIILLN